MPSIILKWEELLVIAHIFLMTKQIERCLQFAKTKNVPS